MLRIQLLKFLLELRNSKSGDVRNSVDLFLSQFDDYCISYKEDFSSGLRGGCSPIEFWCCPYCAGIKPTESSRRNYIKKAIGHKPECMWADYRAKLAKEDKNS